MYRELGQLPFHYHSWRGLFAFWNQVVTAQNSGIWKQILTDAFHDTSRGSWGAQVHAFLDHYGVELPETPFVYAFRIKDFEAAILQEYDKVFADLDADPRQAHHQPRLTTFHR